MGLFREKVVFYLRLSFLNNYQGYTIPCQQAVKVCICYYYYISKWFITFIKIMQNWCWIILFLKEISKMGWVSLKLLQLFFCLIYGYSYQITKEMFIVFTGMMLMRGMITKRIEAKQSCFEEKALESHCP